MRFRIRRHLNRDHRFFAELLLAVGLLLGGFLGIGPVAPTDAQAQPDTVAARFEAANAAYTQGQYTRAVEQYQRLLDDGHASGALYYNLATAYVRLDQLGAAIRYYEKARRLLGEDPRLEHSLEQAQRRAGVYPNELPPRGVVGVMRGWSPVALFLVGLVLLSGGAVGAVMERFAGSARPWRSAVWGAIATGGLLVVGALGVSYTQSLDRRAVVVDDQAVLRETPTDEVAPDTIFPEGTLLEVRRYRGGWTAVRGADGTVGWVPARTLGNV